jgi:hypothetical protein
MVIGTKTIWNPYLLNYPDLSIGGYVYSLEESKRLMKIREDSGEFDENQ